jgi:hypothetical protein
MQVKEELSRDSNSLEPPHRRDRPGTKLRPLQPPTDSDELHNQKDSERLDRMEYLDFTLTNTEITSFTTIWQYSSGRTYNGYWFH